jgi:phosphoserine phosphatase RsbU/P
MVRTFLDRVHLATPGQLGEVVLEAAQQVGWSAQLYLADYEQELLVPVPVTGRETPSPLGIDTTLAGRAFRTVAPVPSHAEEPKIWLPVVDGVERLGVLEVIVGDDERLDDDLLLDRCRLFGHLSGHLVTAKRPYGDALEHLRRRRPRTVASELLHQLLPPLTFACEGLVISGLLQPYYDVAADAFDYSVVDDTAHIAILDATGHDLDGTTLAAIALSAYRNSRRQRHGMFASATAMDALVASHGAGWRLATGVLGELDLSTGRFRYLNAGHIAPLLMRNGRVVKELEGGRRPLFGIEGSGAAIAEEWLEPGDRIVFYTDGITEARTADGTFFGLPRLVDHLERAATAELPAPETLRRISHDVLAHQGGVLRDDATLLIAEWATAREFTLASADGTVSRDDMSPHPLEGGTVRRR